LYPSGSEVLLKGCPDCNGRFFFYVKDDQIEEADQIIKKLTSADKKKIEEDVTQIIGKDKEEKPIVLDIETIKVLGQGSYELDLVDMFKGKPLVYRLEDGKYYIDIASTFEAKDFTSSKKFSESSEEEKDDKEVY
jgi:predicted  nucleic acid-binding Zn-ribbon protein